ncbi:hypothetical protein GUJ93_ZPchr0002g23120 [Zizania palustris]|uniref:Myb-like domain-containing protein n=1 Tax=Zizania palustris TaxID=103762 RepID=A0A8J5S3C6_ZIZPA|nr:hypothetical protein GUJ93_ZPchr0002g23120 [Zizania palustris]
MGRGRAPCCAKVGLNRGSWTPQEDMRLIAYIQKHGHANWRALPKQAGFRGGQACFERDFWISVGRGLRGKSSKGVESAGVLDHTVLSSLGFVSDGVDGDPFSDRPCTMAEIVGSDGDQTVTDQQLVIAAVPIRSQPVRQKQPRKAKKRQNPLVATRQSARIKRDGVPIPVKAQLRADYKDDISDVGIELGSSPAEIERNISLIRAKEMAQAMISLAQINSVKGKMANTCIPVMIGGDFNMIRFPSDKSQGVIHWKWLDEFNDFIGVNELEELGLRRRRTRFEPGEPGSSGRLDARGAGSSVMVAAKVVRVGPRVEACQVKAESAERGSD